MCPQPAEVVSSLGFDLLAKRWVCWITSACKGKVMPNQNAQLIAGIKKGLLLVNAATPYSEDSLK